FFEKIQSLEKDVFLSLFGQGNSLTQIESICKSHPINQESKNKVFENTFLSALNNRIDYNPIPLYKILGVPIPADEEFDLGHFVKNRKNKLTVEIVDGYSYEIVKTKIDNN